MPDQKDHGSLHERLNGIRDQNLAESTPLMAASDENTEERIAKAMGASQKPVVAREKVIGEDAESPKGPVGLDVGTSHIVVAQNNGSHIQSTKELNAFFTVPNAKFAKDILGQKKVMYYERENQYYIFGFSADSFANMFNINTRRPMNEGFLSSREEEGISVIKAIVSSLIRKPQNFGEVLCFAVPGDPLNGNGSVVYHESVIKSFLSGLGYTPISINEGMAVVVSELSEDDFTGIGISMGGGMCNVCLSYLSFPVITYSIQMAGDYIDSKVGRSVGEPATKIKTIKEQELDLSKQPKDRVSTALQIFYDELIFKLIESLQRVLNSSDRIPKISSPIPIVLSGGTALPSGCKEKFWNILNNVNLPVEISSVRLAEDPLNTTAKGALIMAMTEAG
jgi:hypothetical protein